jgi:tetratricopeptide (TPR) repeat protein
MFLKALECEPEVVPKAMMNLGLLYNTRGNLLAQSGDIDGAKRTAIDASRYLDQGKPMLEGLAASGKADSQVHKYIQQYRPLRLQSHRLLGQLYAGAGDMAACESEFRLATESFPDEPLAWQMLQRVLDMQGKKDEAKMAMDKMLSLGK